MLSCPIRTGGFVDPCIPSRAPKPPSGPDWVHEVKHDGYRLIVRRDGETTRLFTRRGYYWTDRYPAIAAAAAELRARSFTLDGEAVVCVQDRVAGFVAAGQCVEYGDAIGPPSTFWSSTAPTCDRCRSAARRRWWRASRSGIVLNEHTDEDGATVFRYACKLGFEGIVSKRLAASYRSGPSRDWIKVKNPDSPAMARWREGRW